MRVVSGLQRRNKLRIVTPIRFWDWRDRKWPLNDGQIPKLSGVRVALSTGYNRRASRNGIVSDLPPEIPPEIPHGTIRNFVIALGWWLHVLLTTFVVQRAQRAVWQGWRRGEVWRHLC